MNNENLQCEWGTSGNVKFINPDDVKAYDSAGNEIEIPVCKCGSFKSMVISLNAICFICPICGMDTNKLKT